MQPQNREIFARVPSQNLTVPAYRRRFLGLHKVLPPPQYFQPVSVQAIAPQTSNVEQMFKYMIPILLDQ